MYPPKFYTSCKKIPPDFYKLGNGQLQVVVPGVVPVFSHSQASSSLTIGLFHLSIRILMIFTNHRFY